MTVVRPVVVIGFLLAAAMPAFAQGSGADSLCVTGENALFTCPIGKKRVSVCASKDLDESKGVMQYRFGTSDKLELVYPEVPAHPSKHFRYQRTYSRVESADIQELEFQRGNVSYAVFTESIKGKNAAGINVTVGGKLTTLKCASLQGVAHFSDVGGLGLPEM